MPTTDDLVANNAAYAAGFDRGSLAMPPAKKVAVLACMDARLDPAKALGLQEGDAHVIRNAGGVASEDAIRSLRISQRLLGTDEIVLIHHTDCGMLTFKDDAVKDRIEAEPESGRLCPRSLSGVSKPTSARRPLASRPARLCPTKRSGASSTTFTPGSWRKSRSDSVLIARRAGDQPGRTGVSAACSAVPRFLEFGHVALAPGPGRHRRDHADGHREGEGLMETGVERRRRSGGEKALTGELGDG